MSVALLDSVDISGVDDVSVVVISSVVAVVVLAEEDESVVMVDSVVLHAPSMNIPECRNITPFAICIFIILNLLRQILTSTTIKNEVIQ